jgi:ATP-dependent helicase/nuclease subunit A
MIEIKKHQLRYGQDGKTGLLFPAVHGKYLPPTTYLRYYFKPMREKVKIEKGFHAFRHTHATQLITAGVPIQEVSRRLGHSRVSTTLDIYTHAVKADEVKAMQAMDDIHNRLKSGNKA